MKRMQRTEPSLLDGAEHVVGGALPALPVVLTVLSRTAIVTASIMRAHQVGTAVHRWNKNRD